MRGDGGHAVGSSAIVKRGHANTINKIKKKDRRKERGREGGRGGARWNSGIITERRGKGNKMERSSCTSTASGELCSPVWKMA